MSRENHKSRTTAVTTDDRHPDAVADGPDQQNTAVTTEDKIHAALADNPGSTAAELATAAGVVRSTAAKILARWDRDGHAIRTTGAGPRHPDTWALAPSDTATVPDVDEERPDPAGAAPDPRTDGPHTVDDAAPKKAITTEVGNPAVTETQAIDEGGATPESEDIDAPDGIDDAPIPMADDGAPADGAAAELPDTWTPSPVDGEIPTEPPTDVPAKDAASFDAAPPDKGRLRKGGLRALVEEYLTEHPGESFGPAKIGKDLGRSGGAVNNALEKLVADGYALKTCEAPKRFTINPAKTDIPQAVRDVP